MVLPTLLAAAYAVRSPAASITMAAGLPDAVSEVLPSKVAEDPGVVPLWRALRGCYPSDEAALTALTANKGIVTPWVVSPSTITSNNALLRGMLGKQRALNVITKNPGVLACDPERLAISSPQEIEAVASATSAVGRASTPLAFAALALFTLALLPSAGVMDAELAGSIVRPASGAIGATAFFAALAGAIAAQRRS